MLSPNFWDSRDIGNKHYMFMLDGCKNDGSARGFYNEFLSAELETHRKTMEIVGARMRTDETDDQLSGLGFSSTQTQFTRGESPRLIQPRTENHILGKKTNTMNDLFASASRLSLRFDTPQGQLSTEDLWSLPLSTNRAPGVPTWTTSRLG
jgi:hypothetical protein